MKSIIPCSKKWIRVTVTQENIIHIKIYVFREHIQNFGQISNR